MSRPAARTRSGVVSPAGTIGMIGWVDSAPPPPPHAATNHASPAAAIRATRGMSGDRMVLRIPAVDRLGDALPVFAHPLDAEALVAVLERLEDREMLAVVALARAEDAED